MTVEQQKDDDMASPGSPDHQPALQARLAHLSDLFSEQADPSPLSDPAQCLKQAGLRVSDYAFFHHVDVLRPIGPVVPQLAVPTGTLTSMAARLMVSAISACSGGGSVVAYVHRDEHGVRLCFCDSSGYSPRPVDAGERLAVLRLTAVEMDALGGTLIVAHHPDQGLVVELLFPPPLCLDPARPSAANDNTVRANRPCPRKDLPRSG